MRFDCFSTWSLLVALSIATIVESNPTFQCKKEGYHADPQGCKVYYRCLEFTIGAPLAEHRFECGPGTVSSKGQDVRDCTVLTPSSSVKPMSAKPSQGCSGTPVPQAPIGDPKCTCEGFMADPKDCSKFYRCVRLETASYKRHEFTCENGTVWDPNIKSCNHAWVANRTGCTGPTVSSPTHHPSPVTEPTVTIASMKPSSARPSQGTSVTPVPNPPASGPQCTCEGFMADPKDCRKFYRCVTYGAGSYKRYEFTCGNGTVWDPNIKSCNHPWAANRVGCTVPTVSSPTPCPSPVTEPTVTIASTKPSSAKPSQGTSNVPTVSSPSPRPSPVTKPTVTIPSVKPSSPRPSHGTSKLPTGCDSSPRPPSVTEPTVTIASVKPTSATPSQGTSVTPAPHPPGSGPHCTCEGFMADPKDCRKFYRCVSYGSGSYKRHEFKCGNGTVWDPNIKSCNHPWAANRVGCTVPTVSSPTPCPSPVTEPTVTIASTKPSSAKPSQGTSNVPTVSSPSPRPSPVTKPTVTIPSVKPSSPRPSHGTSKLPTGCDSSPRPPSVTEPTVTIASVKPSSATPSQGTSVTPAPHPPGSGPHCTCEGFMADPKDCRKFYRCVSYGSGLYKRHEFTCGNGTVWDPNIKSCNHPWAANRVGCTVPTVSSPTPCPSPVTEPTVTIASTKPSSAKPNQGTSNIPTISNTSPRPSPVTKPTVTIPSVKPSSPRPSHGTSKFPTVSSPSPRPPSVTKPTVTIASVKPSSATPSQGTSVTPAPHPPGSGPHCTCEGFMADPKDCRKFYRCVSYGSGSYKRHEFTCGNGTVWDPNIKSCNHPWAANRVGCTVPTVSSPTPCPSPVTEPTVTIASTKPSSAKPSQGTSNVPTVSSSSPRPSPVTKPTVTIPSVKPSSPRPSHGTSKFPTVSSPSPRPPSVTKPTVTIASVKPSSATPSQGTSVTPAPHPPGSGPHCTCEGFMADPKDCRKFYRCVSYGSGSYKRHEFTCGNGTVWDPNIKSCNHPWAANRVGCTVPTVSSPTPCPSPVTKPTVTIASTKPSSAKPSQGTSNVPTVSSSSPRPSPVTKPTVTIPSVKPSSPRPSHGTSKFPTVSSPSPRPPSVTKPTVTIASVKPSSATPSQGTSVTPAPHPPGSGPHCTCEGFMADPKDCRKFYRCVSYGSGSYKRHEFTCGNGTVWDPNIKSCNHPWAANRVGCTVPTVSSPTPCPSPVTEPTVTIASTKPSSAKPSQGTSNVPTVSSSSPRPSPVTKPTVTIPSVKPSSPRPSHGTSKFPTVSSPSPRPPSVTKPTVTIASVKPSSATPSQGTSVTPAPHPPGSGPHCTCEGFMADPKDCRKFYRCVSYGSGSYKRHEFTCGNGTVWDPNIKSCNHPWAANRVGCTVPTVSSPTPCPSPVTEPTVTIASTKPSSAKPSQGTSNVPTVSSSSPRPSPVTKPTVTIPSVKPSSPRPSHGTSKFPTVSSPSPRPPSVTKPTVTIASVKPSSATPSQGTSVTPAPHPPGSGPHCTCEGFMADPKDCRKFYRCVSYGSGSYKRHEFTCGNGTVWDPNIKSCNHPWAANRVGCTVPTVSSPTPCPSPVTEPTVTIASTKPSSAKPSQGTSNVPTVSSPSPRPSPVTKPTVTIPSVKPSSPRPCHGTSNFPTISSPSPRPPSVTKPTVTIASVKPSSATPSQGTSVTPASHPPGSGPHCTCEGFMADPKDCRKFYRCVSYGSGSYKRHEFTCGNGTVWDPNIKTCNHPWAANRVGCTVPTASSPKPCPFPVTEPTVTIASTKPSSAKPSQGTSKFPTVSDSTPRPPSVTGSTVTIASVKPSSATPSQGTSATPASHPPGSGPQCTCEGFMADPKDCRKFYRCVSYGADSYKRHEFTCGNGTVWDPNIKSCNYPWAANRVGCTVPTASSPSPRPPPVTEPTVTIPTVKPSSSKPIQATTVTPVPKPHTDGPQCTCEGFIADPKDCSKFYRCVSYASGSYIRHEFTCGSGTVWDPNIESCNHPWAANRVGCTVPTASSPSPRPPPLTEPTVTIPTVKPSSSKPNQATTVTPVSKPPTDGPQCTCEGFMADPEDCRKFYRCVSYGTGSYKRYEFACGNGTVWDPNIESCNHPWAANRVGCTVSGISSPSPPPPPETEPTVTIPTVKPSSAKPTQATIVTLVPQPPCGGPQCTCEGFMADLEDCSKFYRCVSYGTGLYKRHEFTCGSGTVWDPNIESCNHTWATKRVGCKVGGSH